MRVQAPPPLRRKKFLTPQPNNGAGFRAYPYFFFALLCNSLHNLPYLYNVERNKKQKAMGYEIFTPTKVIAYVPFDFTSEKSILNARRLACQIIDFHEKTSGETFVSYREV